jgi:hypothetical protein
MDTIINEFPDYQKNQLLTEKSLNETTDFLEQQERVTRFGFTKTGIMDGLKYYVSQDNKFISIEIGFGGSRDGFFMHHNYPENSIIYSKCKKYDCEKNNLDLKMLKQAPFKLYGESEKEYPDGVFELLTEDYIESDSFPVSNILSESNTNFVLALFLEITSNGIPGCSSITCDEGGKLKKYRTVPLLINNKNNNIFPEINKWIEQKNFIRIHRFYGLNNLKINFDDKNIKFATYETLINGTNKLNLQNKKYILTKLKEILDFEGPVAFNNLFDNVIKDLFNVESKYNLLNLFKDINLPFAPDTEFLRNESSSDKEAIKEEKREASVARRLFKKYRSEYRETYPPFPYPCQYFIDFCADLELAINEFVSQYNLVNNKYFTSYNGRLKRFLVLGKTDYSEKDPYRYYSIEYYESAGKTSESKKLIQLFSRIFVMIKKFKENYLTIYNEFLYKNPKIKIIPSKSYATRLGDRAIPFYYKRDGLIEQYWRGGENHIPINININNYYNESEECLTHNINENNFFRVEGIIGKDIHEAYYNVTNKLIDYNLPFNVMCLDWPAYLLINQLKYKLELIYRYPEFNKYRELILQTLNSIYFNPQESLKLIEKNKDYVKVLESIKKDSSKNSPKKKARDRNDEYERIIEIINIYNILKKLSEIYGNRNVPFFHCMDHNGGVNSGCTYILVYIKTGNFIKTIADFRVPYLIDCLPLEINPFIEQSCPVIVSEISEIISEYEINTQKEDMTKMNMNPGFIL